MQEAAEVMREISNLRRNTEHSLMRLINFLNQVKRMIDKKKHTFTKKDVLKEAQKKFDKFMKNMKLTKEKQREILIKTIRAKQKIITVTKRTELK